MSDATPGIPNPWMLLPSLTELKRQADEMANELPPFIAREQVASLCMCMQMQGMAIVLEQLAANDLSPEVIISSARSLQAMGMALVDLATAS